MIVVYESEHLYVDYLDRLWITDRGGPHYAGHAGDDPRWPSDLGPEPNWWVTEVAQLEDLWEDGARFARDYRGEVEGDYKRGRV